MRTERIAFGSEQRPQYNKNMAAAAAAAAARTISNYELPSSKLSGSSKMAAVEVCTPVRVARAPLIWYALVVMITFSYICIDIFVGAKRQLIIGRTYSEKLACLLTFTVFSYFVFVRYI